MELEHVIHKFEPIFDHRSQILVLGTFPSVKSRESNFYYGHPQNRFWKVISSLTGERVPEDISAKKEILLKADIAIWDVIASCDIEGSSDSSIKNVIPNDINMILDKVPHIAIFANGGKAYSLYQKYCFPETGKKIIKLPSTSPANAAVSLEKLIEIWGVAFREAGWSYRK